VPKAKKTDDRPVQILLRFPSSLRDWLSQRASENGRSVNAEVISRLEASKADNSAFQQLQDTVEYLAEELENLKHEFRHRYDDPNEPD